MAWDIDSTPTSKSASPLPAGQARLSKTPLGEAQFGNLRNQLLLSYLLVIVAILGTFSAVVYGLVARDRNQQLNDHLRQVVASSASTLDIIQHEYDELLTEPEYANYVPRQIDGTMTSVSLFQLMGKYRVATVTDLVPNPLDPDHLGVEWFSAERRLIVHEGELFPPTPLPADIPAEGMMVQDNHIRSFILPVDAPAMDGTPERIGYVRANETTANLEADLRRFREGLAVGVIVVSGFVTLGGLWLTRTALKPVLQSFEQLRQFTSDASHELRNPLTAIRASISVMQSHPERIHPADEEKLRAIASASTQMSQLVDDLLLLARMDRAAPNQRGWRRMALDEILEDLVELYGDRADQAHLALKAQLVPHLEIYGDAPQLQRLFTNLLTNALQYTPAGGTVTVSLQRHGTAALVTVADTGIGIAPAQLPHIFDRFWRADPARSAQDGGSGLGLAIAQTIAQRHNGDISVSSQPNLGSRFQVKLPLA